LGGLDGLNDKETREYEKLISGSPEIKAYYIKTKAMGRELIGVEYEAARRWADAASERQEDVERAKTAKAARERMAEIN
jgi:hypothetical protein